MLHTHLHFNIISYQKTNRRSLGTFNQINNLGENWTETVFSALATLLRYEATTEHGTDEVQE
jgi:hypothetical protein